MATIHKGQRVAPTFTAGGTVTAGQGYLKDGRFVVALNGGVSGDKIAYTDSGVVTLPLDANATLAADAAAYWYDTAKTVGEAGLEGTHLNPIGTVISVTATTANVWLTGGFAGILADFEARIYALENP